ncbi:hypothetical protein ABZX77_42620 [Streptomyces sp. NPDC004237]|uniref:hypothetical protein n=1 Tax=Streptomyces sp. NPDC004237 TaxID=3154455 RepID=UPI0033B3FEF7
MTVAVLTVLAFLSWFFYYALDYGSTETSVRHEKEVEDKVDQEGPAFTASVREDSPPDAGGIIMDRPLTRQERKELTSLNMRDEGDVKRYQGLYKELVKTHDAKVMNWPSDDSDKGLSRVWLIDLFSDRAASLSIVGMRAKDLKCKPASAKAAMLFIPQGAGIYEGMLFDLSKNTPPTITNEDDEHYGDPYFNYKKIDLGNGATPGGLRVEVNSGTKDCDWVFEVEYRDARGTHKQEIMNRGKRFTVDGIPENLEQKFTLASAPDHFVDCDGKWDSFECGQPGRDEQTSATPRPTVQAMAWPQ